MPAPPEHQFRHRDLNWLSFNARVLQEAEDPNNPLYERIKFLAIFSSNLDEYFRVRVSQLRQIKKVEKSIRKKLALRPNKITKEILERVKIQQDYFGRIYFDQIIPELAENGIYLIDSEHFTPKQKKHAASYYEKNVSSLVKPKKVKFSEDEILFLENNQIYFAVTFKDLGIIGLVNIPSDDCGRFVEFEENVITFLDDIIRNKIPELFPEEKVTGIYAIKLSRDAELYIEDEFDGVLAEKIYESLAQRTDGQATRLLYDAGMPLEVHRKLRKLLGLGKIDMMPGGKYHNFSDFFAFPDPTNNPDLHVKPLNPVKHKILEKAESYFSEIAKKDISVHFPYMSFAYVEKFIEEAANDPLVESIKI